MMMKMERRLLIPVFLLFIATAAYAGGWAIVTVHDLPDCVVAGKPLTLTFTVRQHGVTLLPGLTPSVRAMATGLPDASAVATSTSHGGEYSATLTLPQAGAWTIRINSGFNANATALLPLTVVDSGGPSLPPLPPAERGERLFVAKGCISCHRNQNVAAETLVSVGPDLTGKRFASDFLEEFLADPARTLGRSSAPEYGQMPNLNLKPEEISALVAFINLPRP